jgi:hypothetical protein
MTLQALKPHRILLDKTDKAHAILSKTCAATLSLAERRILILTNGERSLKELLDALGDAILPSVQHLVDEGYLVARPRTKVIDRLVLTPADKIGGLLRGKA